MLVFSGNRKLLICCCRLHFASVFSVMVEELSDVNMTLTSAPVVSGLDLELDSDTMQILFKITVWQLDSGDNSANCVCLGEKQACAFNQESKWKQMLSKSRAGPFFPKSRSLPSYVNARSRWTYRRLCACWSPALQPLYCPRLVLNRHSLSCDCLKRPQMASMDELTWQLPGDVRIFCSGIRGNLC